MGEDNIYTYSVDYLDALNSANSISSYTINSSPSWTVSFDDTMLKEKLDELNRESLKDVELPEDKTSVDLAKLTSEVIIKFLQSPEGIGLLANELDKYFKK